MSDQSQAQEFDESTLTPEAIAHFEKKYAPVISKRDELLGKIGNYKALEKELENLGGLESLKGMKSKADEAAQLAERARLDALAKDGKVTEIEEHYQKLLASKDETLSKYQQKVVAKEVEGKLSKAISEAEGNPALLTNLLRDRVEATMNADGDVVLTVKGAAGQTLGEDGKPLTLKSLVQEFKSNPIYAGAFAAHQASGGGTKKSSAGGGDNPFADGTFNATKQMELIKTDPALAKSLASAAGKKVSW